MATLKSEATLSDFRFNTTSVRLESNSVFPGPDHRPGTQQVLRNWGWHRILGGKLTLEELRRANGGLPALK